ncbi:enolase C-terminal domain-like protein [Sinorhizobium meliloti]|uniref:enolase C-terminal domain-like protein n=1 Tax=Rhizobium meliloti TaxID=382 RepID=UPI0013E3FB13|nr:enolase C-terminal domain-like protein [Sinorhizobium meliloti]
MKRPKISDIRATTVTVPLEAPLRHSNGAHWGRFVRTIIEVETDVGIVGLGEMGGGGESAEAAFRALKPYLVGHDPFELENLRFMICNPTASLYNNRTQMHAAIEFACLDIMGKFLDVPVCDLLGGKMRDAVPFASYMFFRLPNKDTGEGETRTADQLIEQTLALKKKCGFTSHKLKSGVFPPDYELEVFRAWAKALGPDSVEEAIRFVFHADAHYHQLTDDIIVGGPMRYQNGTIEVPTAPGLGVELDRDKLGQYADLHKTLGGYPYDRDPSRPGWFSVVPNTRWADPKNDRVVGY